MAQKRKNMMNTPRALVSDLPCLCTLDDIENTFEMWGVGLFLFRKGEDHLTSLSATWDANVRESPLPRF